MQFRNPFGGIFFFVPVALSVAFAADTQAAEPVRGKVSQDNLASAETTVPPVLSLMVDFASILQIVGDMSAIAVGNPEIADASMVDRSTVVLTGRTAGITNLIALNEAGQVLADVTVRVTSQKPGVVKVRRGTQLQAYSCTSVHCEEPAGVPAIQTGVTAIPEIAG